MPVTVKYTSFSKIPQFTTAGQWECDYDLRRVVPAVDEWVRDNGLDLNPDFQRGHVWKERRQREYLEFFLRGGKTGRVLYFNDPNWGGRGGKYRDFVIVDGLQRLTAARRFLANEIRVFGSYFREYTDNDRWSHRNTFRLNVNDLRSRAEVLRWYLDFNRGGTVHSVAELRRVEQLLAAENGVEVTS